MNVTQINTVVCNSALLANYVNTTDAASLEELSETLCELSDPDVIDLVAILHSELDAKSILLEFEDAAEEHAEHDSTLWSLKNRLVGPIHYDHTANVISNGVQFSSRLSHVVHMEIPMEIIFKDWQVINDYFVEVQQNYYI